MDVFSLMGVATFSEEEYQFANVVLDLYLKNVERVQIHDERMDGEIIQIQERFVVKFSKFFRDCETRTGHVDMQRGFDVQEESELKQSAEKSIEILFSASTRNPLNPFSAEVFSKKFFHCVPIGLLCPNSFKLLSWYYILTTVNERLTNPRESMSSPSAFVRLTVLALVLQPSGTMCATLLSRASSCNPGCHPGQAWSSCVQCLAGVAPCVREVYTTTMTTEEPPMTTSSSSPEETREQEESPELEQTTQQEETSSAPEKQGPTTQQEDTSSAPEKQTPASPLIVSTTSNANIGAANTTTVIVRNLDGNTKTFPLAADATVAELRQAVRAAYLFSGMQAFRLAHGTREVAPESSSSTSQKVTEVFGLLPASLSLSVIKSVVPSLVAVGTQEIGIWKPENGFTKPLFRKKTRWSMRRAFSG